MSKKSVKEFICDLLQSAGIYPNGHEDWDIQIHNEDFYIRVFKDGSLGLGESYVDGWWDCKNLDQFIDRIMLADLKIM